VKVAVKKFHGGWAILLNGSVEEWYRDWRAAIASAVELAGALPTMCVMRRACLCR